MKEERFDELWTRAEAKHYASELAAEYPAWRRRQHRRMGATALSVVALGVMLTGTLGAPAGPDSYAMAYCNNNALGDQYWVDLAGDLLMESV